MLPNVCIMDRQHGPDQLVLIDQDHSESIQHVGNHTMYERSRSVSPTSSINTQQLNSLQPAHVCVGRANRLQAAGPCGSAANNVVRLGTLDARTNGTGTKGVGAG